jgi:two-component system chemotaxis sensor kinase CheA
MGLIVDEFLEATDIILNPLDGILGGLRGYAGTALRGDGSILMVLSPAELVA